LSAARTLPSRPSRALLRLLGAVALVLALAPLSGCGESSPVGTSASPASVVPASAPLYIDATVQPSGSLKSAALSAGRTLTQRSNPYGGLLKLLQGPSGKTPVYTSEVKPWLGPEAGIFLSSAAPGAGQGTSSAAQGLLQEALSKALAEGLTGAEAALTGSSGLSSLLAHGSVQGALVLDTTNVSSARSFLEAQGHSAGAHSLSYRGVSYEVAPDGIAEGIVHRFAVIGSEAGLKSVIETELGGPALAKAAGYSKLLASAEPGRLANAYLNLQALAGAVKLPGSGESLIGLLRGVLGQAGQVYASLIPTSSAVALDLDTLPSTKTTAKSGAGSASGEGGTSGAQVLRGLPGGAWLALGFGDLGKTLGGGSQALQALSSLVSGISFGGFSVARVFAPLHSPAIDVQRDLLSWMGATGIYVSGSSLLNLQAAVVIDSKNPARSRAAVAKLASAYREAGGEVASTSVPGTETAMTIKLPGFPLTLTMAVGRGKFVLGLGAASVQEALNPQSTLAGTAAYNAAASALGQGIEPSAAIEFHTLLGLMESVGLTDAPGFSGIAQAVKPLSSLAAGGGKSLGGGVKRARLTLALASGG
jgi:hypothetical protein